MGGGDGDQHDCIKTEKLIFLDIRNYLAPNYSYSQYIKAYRCKEGKGFFPYEWMNDLKKLDQTTLPEHKEFYSSLKNNNISEEEYQYCQRVWTENNMTSFRDYLEWYNGLDVSPFMEALEKQSEFYQGELHLDMFKDAISVPGLTLRYLFNTIDPTETSFTLFDKYNSDLHDLIKEWNVGGPSIVFNRYQEAGVTKINQHLYGAAAKLCQSVVGYDANSLYLACLMEQMPTGLPIRRKAEENFAPKQSDVFGRMACEWLEWEANQMDIKITHKYNSKEKRIGQRQLPVDGYCAQTNTVYQFHGDMDTDSAYLGLSGNTLEDIVKPEMKKEFYEEWDKWFPSEACPTHKQDFVITKLEGKEWIPSECCQKQKKFDRRTPGLMKIEWKGKGMIALCSKCYFGWGKDGEKKSTKGINKAQNDVPLTKAHLRRLKRYRTDVRALVQKRSTHKRKRKILQKGGFLGALLAPVAATVLADIVKKVT